MSSNSFHYSPPTQYNNTGPVNTRLDDMYREKIRSLVIGQNQECLFCNQKFPTYTLHLHDKKTDKDHTSGIGFISERCATVLRSFPDISGGQIRNIANSRYSKEEYQLAESTGNEFLRRIYFPTNFQDEKHKPKSEVLLKGSDQQKSQFDKQVSQLFQKFVIDKAYYKPQAQEQLDVTFTKDKIENFQPNTLSRINHMVPTSTIDKLSGKEEDTLEKSMNTLTLKTSPRSNPSQVKPIPNPVQQPQQQPQPQQQYPVQQKPMAQPQQPYPMQQQPHPQQSYPMQQQQQPMYYPPQQHYYGNTAQYPPQPQYGMMPPQQPMYQQFVNYPMQQPHPQQQAFYSQQQQQQQVPYYGQQAAPKQPQQPTHPSSTVNPFSDEFYFGAAAKAAPVNIPPVNTASIVNNNTTASVPPKTTTSAVPSVVPSAVSTPPAPAPPAPPAPNQLKTSPRAPTSNITPSTIKVSPRATTNTSTASSKPPMAPSSVQIQQQQQLLRPASTETSTINRDKRTGSVGSNQNTAAVTTTTTANTTPSNNQTVQNRARSASGGINFNQVSPRGGLSADAQFQLEKISKDEADAHSFEKERERATKLDDLQAQARSVKGEDDDIVWNIKPTLKPMAMKKIEKQ